MAGQTETVIDLIIAQIDNGEILPGEPIEEKVLMELCGVSRTPVREAMIRLETLGLSQRSSRKGITLFKPTIPEFLTILEVNANLESFAAGLAAQRITAAQSEELNAVIKACEAHATRYRNTKHAEYYQLNMQFHEIIIRAASNEVLSDLIKINARKLMSYYRSRYRLPNASIQSAQEHREIGGFILEGQSAEASAAMLEHFNYDRQTVMDLISAGE